MAALRSPLLTDKKGEKKVTGKKEKENIEQQCGCLILDLKEKLWGDGVFQYNVIKHNDFWH